MSSRDGINYCRAPNDNDGCCLVLFPSKGINYQKICGMARSYQKGVPNAFWRYINANNIDRLSITHGNPHQHNNYGHLLLVSMMGPHVHLILLVLVSLY